MVPVKSRQGPESEMLNYIISLSAQSARSAFISREGRGEATRINCFILRYRIMAITDDSGSSYRSSNLCTSTIKENAANLSKSNCNFD